MNRLAVYSYLTRYTYGHTGYGILFTGPVPEKSSVRLVEAWTTGQEDNSAPRTALRGSDVGLDTARVR